MTLTAQSLLAELDTALDQASDSWRRTALERITSLFVGSAEFYSRDQVAIFDEVMCRLIRNMDRAPLAELSNTLAPHDNAPINVIVSLARHRDLAVCGPVLEQAKALPDKDLAEIAGEDRTDPNQLMKIAARPQLSAAVTDALLKHGNAAIQRKVIDNPNARVSETGFAKLILGINGDKSLAAAIAARQDVPAELRLWLGASKN
jgi:uncharacterized protein (DUF2336 family)